MDKKMAMPFLQKFELIATPANKEDMSEEQ